MATFSKHRKKQKEKSRKRTIRLKNENNRKVKEIQRDLKELVDLQKEKEKEIESNEIF